MEASLFPFPHTKLTSQMVRAKLRLAQKDPSLPCGIGRLLMCLHMRGITYALNVMNINPKALETTCEPSPTRDL